MVPVLTPRVIIVTIIVVVLAAAVLLSGLDPLSKAAAFAALVIAEVLAFRRPAPRP